MAIRKAFRHKDEQVDRLLDELVRKINRLSVDGDVSHESIAEIRREVETIESATSGEDALSPLYLYVVDDDGRFVVDDDGNYVIAGLAFGHSAVADDEPERHIVSGKVDMGTGTDIDMSQGGSFYRTMGAGNTTFTISNPVQDAAVMLLLSHDDDSEITLPASCVVIKGAYDPSAANYLGILCVDAVTPVYLVTYSKQVV